MHLAFKVGITSKRCFICDSICWGHIECKVVKEVDAGIHTMFIAEIVAASANEGCFENSIILGDGHAKMISFLGGNKYGIIERCELAPMTKEEN